MFDNECPIEYNSSIVDSLLKVTLFCLQMANAAELDFSDEQWAQEMLSKLVDQHISLSESLDDLRYKSINDFEQMYYGRPRRIQ